MKLIIGAAVGTIIGLALVFVGALCVGLKFQVGIELLIYYLLSIISAIVFGAFGAAIAEMT